MNKFRKNVSVVKLRTFSKLPISILEFLEYMRTYTLKTASSETFIFHNYKMSNVTIFMCQHNLDTLNFDYYFR